VFRAWYSYGNEIKDTSVDADVDNMGKTRNSQILERKPSHMKDQNEESERITLRNGNK